MRPCRLVSAWPLLGFMLSSVPTSGHGQHGTAGYGSMPMAPHSSALLETRMAAFSLPGRSGVWQTLSLRLEYAPLKVLSFSARPELARVEYEDGATAFGSSDTELAAKALIWSAARASLSGGLSVELPTGDAVQGTGNGHVSLLPFVAFSIVPLRELMLHAMLGDRVAVAADEHAAHGTAHGSVLMPHGQNELVMHLGSCIMLERWRISPGLEWMQMLDPESKAFVNAQLELAYALRSEVKLAAAIDLPLTAQHRFDWRGRLMSAWLW